MTIAERPADTSPEGEQALIRRICNGNSSLFAELVKPYERRVYVTALALLRNDADAQDVAQEAILKAFANLRQFRGESRFSTWLIQIAMNEAKMRLRKDRRKLYDSIDQGQLTDEGDYIPTDFADWRQIPSEALEQGELRAALKKAILSLAEKYRTVLILRDVQQLSIAETAKTLGITEENVKTRTSRARLQLRDALAPGWGGGWTQQS